MAIRPLVKRKSLKKRMKPFIRHQSDRYKKLKVGWTQIRGFGLQKRFVYYCVIKVTICENVANL